MANAYNFVKEFPDQVNTIVGDRGVLLSGGQRQRIALARALIRDPELLILDEATSALDTESEELIQSAINNIKQKVTIVVVAHRLSTINKTDYVYVLRRWTNNRRRGLQSFCLMRPVQLYIKCLIGNADIILSLIINNLFFK